jgi:hypothetical protein
MLLIFSAPAADGTSSGSNDGYHELFPEYLSCCSILGGCKKQGPGDDASSRSHQNG